jgi:hypothetical protein
LDLPNVDNTGFPHIEHPISPECVAYVEDANRLPTDTGSIDKSPERIAAFRLLRESQLRSGAASRRNVGSWSSVVILVRNGCACNAETRGGGNMLEDACCGFNSLR